MVGASGDNRAGVAGWEWGKLRPFAELNDLDKLHDSGQGGEGAPEGRAIEVANPHHKLRVALEQRNHGGKL